MMICHRLLYFSSTDLSRFHASRMLVITIISCVVPFCVCTVAMSMCAMLPCPCRRSSALCVFPSLFWTNQPTKVFSVVLSQACACARKTSGKKDSCENSPCTSGRRTEADVCINTEEGVCINTKCIPTSGCRRWWYLLWSDASSLNFGRVGHAKRQRCKHCDHQRKLNRRHATACRHTFEKKLDFIYGWIEAFFGQLWVL